MVAFMLDARAAKILAEISSYCQHSIVSEPWLALRDKCCGLNVEDMNIEMLSQ
jgi:hypothetical protein